jgi:hypothetical protein
VAILDMAAGNDMVLEPAHGEKPDEEDPLIAEFGSKIVSMVQHIVAQLAQDPQNKVRIEFAAREFSKI